MSLYTSIHTSAHTSTHTTTQASTHTSTHTSTHMGARYAVSMAPALAYYANLSWRMDAAIFQGIYWFPPFRLADFGFGMVLRCLVCYNN